jgi:tetratricopeptide (TPR) repeat protein
MSRAEGPLAAQVVEILSGGLGGTYGSGYQVGPSLVLTARHVAENVGELGVRFGTRAAGPVLGADVAWAGKGSVDLALVEIKEAGTPETVIAHSPEWGFLPPAALGSPGGSVPFSAVGFPRYQAGRRDSGHPYRDTVTVRGQVHLGSYHKTGRLDLAVSSVGGTSPPDWKGLSGAAIFVYGSLVGVVVEARPGRGRLTGMPIATALTEQTLRFPEFTSSPSDREAVKDVLARSGVGVRTVPARRRPYAATVQGLAARPDLLGRDAELSRLTNWLRSATPYALWRAEPWAGKTALAARLAADPPPGVDVVAFFISRVRGAQAGRLWATVADQLAALLYEEMPQDGDLKFEQLWWRACEASRAAGRTLLLLLDGVDEFEERRTADSLLARLPPDPPPHAHVLLLSRPNPELPRAVPHDHPLRDAARCDQVDLDPSPHAAGPRDQARLDLETVQGDGGIPLRALRLIAAVGPLSKHEVFRAICGPDPAADDGAVYRALTSGASGRLLSLGSGNRETRFALAHDTLREELLDGAGLDAAETDIARLLVMADEYAERGWPEGTPDFLLDEYPSLLARRGDASRLTATMLSSEWLDLAQRRTGTVLSAAAALRSAITAIADDPAADLATLLLLAAQLDQLNPPPDYHTASFVTAWARAGELEYAEHVALRLADPMERCQMLIDLAAMAADAGSRDRAVRLLDRAAEFARDVRAARAGGNGGRGHAPDAGVTRARETGDTPKPAEPGQPLASQLEHNLDLFMNLQQLAVRLGRVGPAREAGDEIWSLLPLLPPAKYPERWVRGMEGAAATGNTARVNLGITRLAAIPLPASRKGRLDDVVRALGHEELASRLQAIPVYADGDGPSPDTVPSPAREAAAPDSRPAPPGTASSQDSAASSGSDSSQGSVISPRPAGEGGTFHATDAFDAVEAAISAGAYADAAALIDDYQHPVANILDLIERGEARVVSAAMRAAAAGGPAAVPVLAAAERFVQRGDLGAGLVWTSSMGSGAFPVHGMIGEPGGTFLAAIVEVAAQQGQLEELLRQAVVSPDLATRTKDFGALAVGAARSGQDDVAARLLDGVRDTGPSMVACYEVARCWARTGRWRDAIDLMRDFRPSPERSRVTATAALTAIAAGDVQDGISLLSECLGMETLPGDADELLSAAAVTAAEADHWLTALILAEALDDGLPRAQLWAALSVIAQDAGDYSGADQTLEEAFRESRELPDPTDRADALGACAAVAFHGGDLEASVTALGQAAEVVQVPPSANRTDCLLHLADVATEIGDEARAASLLHQAAAAAHLIEADGSGIERLAAVAAAACVAGPPSLAASLLSEVTDSPHLGSLTSVGELVTAAAKNDHATEALRLLRRFAAVSAPEHLILGFFSPKPRHASQVAEIAAGAELWPVVDEAVGELEPRDRIDVLAELAESVRDQAPRRARRWICQAFLLGISPRLLAAAARLDPSLALPAARIFLARSHASVLPDGA